METISSILASLKIPAIAGLIGGIVSFRFIDVPTWPKRIGSAAAGALIAHYGTPLVTNYFDMHDRFEPSIGFMLGLFGMSIVTAMVQYIPEYIKRKAGGG
jgi:hypothetical protein